MKKLIFTILTLVTPLCEAAADVSKKRDLLIDLYGRKGFYGKNPLGTGQMEALHQMSPVPMVSPVVANFKTDNPEVIEGIPDKYISRKFVQGAQDWINKNPNNTTNWQRKVALQGLEKELGDIDMFDNAIMVGKGNFTISFTGGALQEATPVLKQWLNLSPGHAREEYFKKLTENYKIHFMPQYGDKMNVLIKLVEFFKKNPYLLKKVPMIKARYSDDVQELEQGFAPEIIIYVSAPPTEVQEVLDGLYNTFKSHPGSNNRPRYNGKVTDLIWVAQGNGNDKDGPEWSQYYEQPNMIYYKPDIGGTEVNYHLKHPETHEDIVDFN